MAQTVWSRQLAQSRHPSTYSKVVSVIVSRTFKDILVYPIPAKDELLVQYPSSEKIIIKLTDEMGRERGIAPVQDNRGASLPTSTLPPGIYFLYISNGRESTYKKIVIEWRKSSASCNSLPAMQSFYFWNFVSCQLIFCFYALRCTLRPRVMYHTCLF